MINNTIVLLLLLCCVVDIRAVKQSSGLKRNNGNIPTTTTINVKPRRALKKKSENDDDIAPPDDEAKDDDDDNIGFTNRPMISLNTTTAPLTPNNVFSSPTTPSPTPRPTRRPTTPSPTRRPTTPSPTPRPTRRPTTARPSSSPSSIPTGEPTPRPTTDEPTTRPPTGRPTSSPTTSSPTTSRLTTSPTNRPTDSPTSDPTIAAVSAAAETDAPTVAQPVVVTDAPTTVTASATTDAPTVATPITDVPTSDLVTDTPTATPTTKAPTAAPTNVVTESPTDLPTLAVVTTTMAPTLVEIVQAVDSTLAPTDTVVQVQTVTAMPTIEPTAEPTATESITTTSSPVSSVDSPTPVPTIATINTVDLEPFTLTLLVPDNVQLDNDALQLLLERYFLDVLSEGSNPQAITIQANTVGETTNRRLRKRSLQAQSDDASIEQVSFTGTVLYQGQAPDDVVATQQQSLANLQELQALIDADPNLAGIVVVDSGYNTAAAAGGAEASSVTTQNEANRQVGDASNGNGNNSTAGVIGGVIGASALVVLVAIFARRRKRKDKRNQEVHSVQHLPEVNEIANSNNRFTTRKPEVEYMGDTLLINRKPSSDSVTSISSAQFAAALKRANGRRDDDTASMEGYSLGKQASRKSVDSQFTYSQVGEQISRLVLEGTGDSGRMAYDPDQLIQDDMSHITYNQVETDADTARKEANDDATDSQHFNPYGGGNQDQSGSDGIADELEDVDDDDGEGLHSSPRRKTSTFKERYLAAVVSPPTSNINNNNADGNNIDSLQAGSPSRNLALQLAAEILAGETETEASGDTDDERHLFDEIISIASTRTGILPYDELDELLLKSGDSQDNSNNNDDDVVNVDDIINNFTEPETSKAPAAIKDDEAITKDDEATTTKDEATTKEDEVTTSLRAQVSGENPQESK